ncbi:MAG: (2Fe-2S) ferredoxin domain-containing protein [bacterium]|jgi:(2Fe-2S) ferredoxin|nr:(2Fe-2S) ferredoxin domain-containing protein [Planctomycetota bacterium]HIL52844.1 (2Fe-2S) ferredoxin domain-containing protein [Planctomycetota bacterium]
MKHIFVCIANRPPMAGESCGAAGSALLMESLQLALMKHGLTESTRLNGCTCLGPCEQGINMVVYPDGTNYARVTPEDAEEIVKSHLLEGIPVGRLVHVESGV